MQHRRVPGGRGSQQMPLEPLHANLLHRHVVQQHPRMPKRHGKQPGARLDVTFGQRTDLGDDQPHRGDQHVEEQVGLASVVVVDPALGRPQAIGDGIDRRGGVAELGEQLRGRMQDVVAPVQSGSGAQLGGPFGDGLHEVGRRNAKEAETQKRAIASRGWRSSANARQPALDDEGDTPDAANDHHAGVALQHFFVSSSPW